MDRYTIPEDLIRSAKRTADAWEQPVFIGCERERENQAAGEIMVTRDRPQVIAVIVFPYSDTVEVMPGWKLDPVLAR